MRQISLHDAKTNLSSLVEHAAQGNSAIITIEDQPKAVIIGIDEWNKIRNAQLSFGRLLASSGLDENDIPPRNQIPLGRN